MNDSKEGFASFIADASRGRKIGAILSWIAAAVLLVALFTPMFNVGYQEDAEDIENLDDLVLQVVDEVVNELGENPAADALEKEHQAASQGLEEDESALNTLEALYNPVKHNVSLLDYLVKYDKLLNKENSSVFGIAMLVLYAVLVIGAIITALFTMMPLSTICTVGAALQMLLLYFLRVKTFMNPDNLADFPISFSIVCIILLIVAVVFALVGLIVGLVVKDKAEEPDEWTKTADSNAPTGLFDHISFVQLNTGKVFEIPGHKETVIGKSKTSDIVIANPTISRAHAKIFKQNDVFVIVDLNSSNGTYVGDNKLPGGGQAVLKNGDYITLGNEMFQIRMDQNTYGNSIPVPDLEY